MQLPELFLDRFLYRAKQTVETQGADYVSSNVTEPPSSAIASGNSVTDVNTNAEQLNGAVIAPGTIPATTLDLGNWGWAQTSIFSVTDADTVAWTSGTFTSANGATTLSIGAGNTGNMAAMTYVYLDINVSTTAYQISTSVTAPVGLGKVLIAVCQNGSVTATYALVQAIQIVGDNIIANTINAGKLSVAQLSAITADMGSITAGSILVVNGGNTIGFTPSGTYAIFSGTTGSPQFTVTPAGNVVVSSLERQDFHWFTLFESIDGYAKGGAGTQTLNPDHVALATTGASSSVSSLQKDALYSSNFTWSKRRKMKFGVRFNQNTSQYIDMVTGGQSYGVGVRQFGFRVINGTLYGLSCDGTVEDTPTLVGTVSTGTTYELEARLTPGVSVEYYVNGTLADTSVAGIPSGTTDAAFLFNFYIRATTASLCSFLFTYYDFWQQN